VEFTVKDSFQNRNNRCYLIFKQHENDYFIFGKNLLKKYKIELLNDNKINLYSNKNFVFVGISMYNKNKFLFYFLAITCIIILLICLCVKNINWEAKQKVN
jgi:hypothetical protein